MEIPSKGYFAETNNFNAPCGKKGQTSIFGLHPVESWNIVLRKYVPVPGFSAAR
jgi:hypothetical protein